MQCGTTQQTGSFPYLFKAFGQSRCGYNACGLVAVAFNALHHKPKPKASFHALFRVAVGSEGLDFVPVDCAHSDNLGVVALVVRC